MTDREAFLAGERPDDVAFFLSESVADADTLADAATAERVAGGVVVVATARGAAASSSAPRGRTRWGWRAGPSARERSTAT